MRSAAASLLLLSGLGRAQQAPARAPTSPPPINWPSPPLPDGPIDLDTGVQHKIRLIVPKGLNQPWSMAFLPDGAILITERPGRLRIVRNGVLDPKSIAGVPQVQARGFAGLMDLALHPRFTENKLIYFTYHKPAEGTAANAAGVITLARARWDGTALQDVRDLFSTIPSGNASRIVFGKDGMLYMTVGVGDPPEAARAQDHNDLAGKVMRLRDDGTVPPDNPSWAAPDTARRFTPWVIATPWDWPSSPIPARFGNARTGPTEAMRSTFFSPARTTAGPSLALAVFIWDHA